jgi:hypothetical protein
MNRRVSRLLVCVGMARATSYSSVGRVGCDPQENSHWSSAANGCLAGVNLISFLDVMRNRSGSAASGRRWHSAPLCYWPIRIEG